MMSDYDSIIDYYSLLAMQNPGKCTYHGPSEPDDLIDRLRTAYQCCKACGTKYGVYSVGCSSSWVGKCDVCDAETYVTETRDYAYLITGIRRVEAARKSAG
jgi:hypothetical protein